MKEMRYGCFKGFQNLVASTYQTKMGAITVTWFKRVFGQGLCVQLDENKKANLVKSWLFWKKQGFRSLEFFEGCRVQVFWDVRTAKFSDFSKPEPESGYYLVVVCGKEIVLLLGDREQEAMKKSRTEKFESRPSLVARREHVLGKDRCFSTVARFGHGERCHELCISITNPNLVISVDGKTAIEVRHLSWKFRGNDTIRVGGVPMQFFWDVHDWVFDNGESRNRQNAHRSVFVFQFRFHQASAYERGDLPSDSCLFLHASKL